MFKRNILGRRKATFDQYSKPTPPKKQKNIDISETQRRQLIMDQQLIYKENLHKKIQNRLQSEIENLKNEIEKQKIAFEKSINRQIYLYLTTIQLDLYTIQIQNHYNQISQQFRSREELIDGEIIGNAQNGEEIKKLFTELRMKLRDNQQQLKQTQNQINKLQEKINIKKV